MWGDWCLQDCVERAPKSCTLSSFLRWVIENGPLKHYCRWQVANGAIVLPTGNEAVEDLARDIAAVTEAKVRPLSLPVSSGCSHEEISALKD